MVMYLPGDLVILVLLRLPGRSLMRFKCVCKSWHAMISDRSFITKRLLIFNDPTTTQFLVKRSDRISYHQVYSFLSYQTLEVCSATQVLPMCAGIAIPELIPGWGEPFVQIFGSCNGVFCVGYTGQGQDIPDDYFLWNPATQESKVLPKSDTDPWPWTLPYGPTGFGYDEETGDFKVLRMCVYDPSVHIEYGGEETGEDVCHVEIYNLSTDSWRALKGVFTGRVFMPLGVNGISTCTNRMCSWSATDILNVCILVSFDMKTEIFYFTPLPDVRSADFSTGKQCLMLSDFTAMAVLGSHDIESCEYLDLWVLLEYGVKESWIKLLSIEQLSGSVSWPLGFWKNGELLMETCEGELVLYDPLTCRQLKNLQVDGVPDSLAVVAYMETQVSLQVKPGRINQSLE